MFLDPDPRNIRRPQSQTEYAGFSPPLSPIASPADQRILRKPLLERSANRPVQQKPHIEDEEPFKRTVRLVRPSPSVASIRKELFGDTEPRLAKRESWKSFEKNAVERHDLSTVESLNVEEEKGLAKKQYQDLGIENLDLSQLPADTPQQLQQVWQPRNISDSGFSEATTLQGRTSVSDVSYSASVFTERDRMSSGTTLKDVSLLQDKTLESLDESLEESGTLDEDFSYLAGSVIHETPSRSTIRTVTEPSSPTSDLPSASDFPQSAETPRAGSPVAALWSTPDQSESVIDSSPPVSFDPEYASSTPERIPDRPTSPQKRLAWSSSPEQSDVASNASPARTRNSFAPAIPPRISSRHASLASISIRRPSSGLATPETVQQYSPQQSEASNRSFLPASSPNFVAWTSSPRRPRSQSHPLRGEASYESISARLKSDALRRGKSGHSRSRSSDPASSLESLPSIHVPRRRLRQVRGSLSMDATRRLYSDEQSDTEPYPRQGFSGNLSTIASESDRSRSRTASQQMTQLSFGSEIMRMGDSTAFPGRWSNRRFEKSAVHKYDSRIGSQESAGDMTLGLFREDSAKPEPLFRKDNSDISFSKTYDGPLPPLPPVPALLEGSEHLDVLAELTSPKLRQQRSGYSLKRQRSSSTPLHSRQVSIVSYNDSDRWSTGSSIFPTWAKHFYAGDIALASMSQISLYLPPPARDGAMNGMRFDRYPSRHYSRSMSSRPGTSTSEQDPSPESYRVLPAIFRSRVRQLRLENSTERMSADTVRPSDAVRTMSLQSNPDITVTTEHDEITPAQSTPQQPRSAHLKNESSPHTPLSHKHAKQKRWNGMILPRPMTSDRLSEIRRPIPHLAPTKRSSAHLDTWRPPSFVESIDLILKSKGHRQILFFLVGFVCPLVWMVGAVMPLPPRPVDAFEVEKGEVRDDDMDQVMQQHEAGEAAMLWQQEKAWRQGRWWRNVNRVMSVVGLFIIAAVIAIAVVATR